MRWGADRLSAAAHETRGQTLGLPRSEPQHERDVRHRRTLREMLALDDPLNDAVSANVSTRSGFV
jgi:hypothetical protein